MASLIKKINKNKDIKKSLGFRQEIINKRKEYYVHYYGNIFKI